MQQEGYLAGYAADNVHSMAQCVCKHDIKSLWLGYLRL